MVQNDDFPTVGFYRGTPLHDFQSRERIKNVVCPQIDAVLELARPRELLAFANDCRHTPEARLLAAKRVLEMTKAAGQRQSVGVSLSALDASVAGLESLRVGPTDSPMRRSLTVRWHPLHHGLPSTRRG